MSPWVVPDPDFRDDGIDVEEPPAWLEAATEGDTLSPLSPLSPLYEPVTSESDTSDRGDTDVAGDLLAKVSTARHLMREDIPPVQWAVPGLLPEGYVLIAGSPKVGKSWLALSLAIAVATGGTALGLIPVGDPRPVLYLGLEDGKGRMQRRLRHLGVTGDGPDLLHYVCGDVLDPQASLTLVGAWLDQHKHDRPVVFIDTLTVATGHLGGQDSYRRDYAIGTAIKRLVERAPGCTVVPIHHTRKALSDDWMDAVSGTNGVNGAADATLVLTRKRGEDVGRLAVTGRDIETDGTLALALADAPGMTWLIDGESIEQAMERAREARETENLGDVSGRVLAHVNAHPEGVGPKDCALALGISTDAAKQALPRLWEAGRIRKLARGVYVPLDTERDEP